MTNNKQGQASDDKNTNKDLPSTHISKEGKKEDGDAIYLQPDEDNTLQTPEEYAKDKGKKLEDGDEISVNTEE